MSRLTRYVCPTCQRATEWSNGMTTNAGDERDEFWCIVCGTETPLEDCEVADLAWIKGGHQ